MSTTRVLFLAILPCLLLCTPRISTAEDEWYTVWTRGAPVLKPSGIKDYGSADAAGRFLNTVEATASRLRVVHKVTRGAVVEKHVTLELTFNAPPAELRVGDAFTMDVRGKAERHDRATFYAEVAWAQVLAKGLGIDHRHKLGAGTPAVHWKLRTKINANPGGEFDVTVSLGAGSVTWTYRAQRVRARPEDRGGAIGRVEHVVGVVERMERSRLQWQPVQEGMILSVGTTLRTKGGGKVVVSWNRPNEEGSLQTVLGGRPSMMRIEDMARPEKPFLVFNGGVLRYVRRLVQGTTSADVIRIQAGDITAIPQGTEFLLIHASATRTVACYVREGRVLLRGSGGRTVTLASGRSVTAVRGVVGTPLAMGPGQWEGLNKSLLPGATTRRPAPERAGGFRPVASAVRFFESGQGTPAVKQRIYRTRFPGKQAKFINWELALAHSGTTQRHAFDIEARWYRSDGTRHAQQTLRSSVERGLLESVHSHGWGAASVGAWQPGWYRVDLHLAGEKIASASFEITR